MIEAHDLTKRYGDKTAVDGLSFTASPGEVTGFLGPNGAGKSTTMRMVMGLDRPSAGSVTVNGKPYAQHRAPLREAGALLEAKAVHPGRSARTHLLSLAQTEGIPAARVDEVLEVVGLAPVARKRAGAFSLGMGQRLGIAVALLGDPATVILDEPVNGLDPDGVQWIRTLLVELAGQGRTVFLSSHLMSEMALTATHLVIVGRGRLLADTSVAALIASASERPVLVRSPDAERLASALTRDGASVDAAGPGLLSVGSMPARRIGEIASSVRAVLHELSPQAASLEDAYMELTRDSREYVTDGTDGSAGSAGSEQGSPAGGVQDATTDKTLEPAA